MPFLKQYTAVTLSLLGAILLGGYFWTHSVPPPFSFPGQEANVYWSHLLDIAHKWRAFHIPWWDLGVGGGLSTFTSAQYPILNPLNAFAWVLNNDQFSKFNLLAPYAVGFFFTALLLMDIFKLNWAFAFYGALSYLGIALSCHTILPESPLTLWGCYLLPAALYAYHKTSHKNLYGAVAIVGALLAFQFANSGMTTYLQNVYWWICFFMVEFLLGLKVGPLLANAKQKTLCIVVLLITATGLFALQFIPLYAFITRESARSFFQYPVNNLPLSEVFDLFLQYLSNPIGGISGWNNSALLFICLALIAVNFRKLCHDMPGRQVLTRVWLTTGLYLLSPTIIEILCKIVPPFKYVIAPLTMVTMRYAINTLDFCLGITIAVILGQAMFKLKGTAMTITQKILAWGLVAAALVMLAYPFVTIIPGVHNILQTIAKLKTLDPAHHFSAWFIVKSIIVTYLRPLLFFAITSVAVIYVLLRPKNMFLNIAVGLSLCLMGFAAANDCFHWNEKGQKTKAGDYHTSSVEFLYFKYAAKKYYLPYDMPEDMGDIYPLRYGLYSTTGFYACAPLRLSNFMGTYHNDHIAKGLGQMVHFEIKKPSAAIPTYFPVEFTTIAKGQTLPWPGFTKVIDGEYYDIWERQGPPPHIFFAHRLQVLSFDKIIERFDVPFDQSIAIETKDAALFKLGPINLAPAATSLMDWDNRQDNITFTVQSKLGTFIMVPTMFQRGWKAWDNGKPIKLFPANYIFLGMQIPAGEHHIEMKFTPPGLAAGIVFNIFALLLIMFLWRKDIKRL